MTRPTGEQCVVGYVCNPQTYRCVRPQPNDCASGGVCASDVATGSGCTPTGSFLPCVDGASDCGGGCRTCLGEAGWSACATCVGDRDQDQVADCIDNCPDSANSDQADDDDDGTGDACDAAPDVGYDLVANVTHDNSTMSGDGYALSGRIVWLQGLPWPVEVQP